MMMDRNAVVLLSGGLDSTSVVGMANLLRREGKAVILTTHHLDDAERLGTRFGLLHQGRLVIEGTLAEYPGPLVVASHDRHFLGAIGVTGVLLLEDGRARRLPDLAAYEAEALAGRAS